MIIKSSYNALIIMIHMIYNILIKWYQNNLSLESSSDNP